MFVPFFFVMAGAYMQLELLGGMKNLVLILVLTVIAIAGKLAAGLGAVGTKANKWAVGVGMVPRGEVGLIFATFGLSSGLIDNQLYAVLVMVIILTTFITPPILKPIMAKIGA